MLLVRTYIAPSKIHGLGLFAAEPITAGTVYWREDLLVEPLIPPDAFAQLPTVMQEFINTYGWREAKNGPWRLERDNARFTNHSTNPNLGYSGNGRDSVAIRDIEIGDEMTENYGTYDADYAEWATANNIV